MKNFLCLFILSFPLFSREQNVGIGTTSPIARLQINHSSSSQPGVLLKDSTTSGAGLLQFQNMSSSKFITLRGYNFNSNANSFLDVSSDSAFIATFRGNGNMGVGNLNPNEKLDVTGNINLTGTIKANGISGQPGQVLTSNGTTLNWTDMSPYNSFITFVSPGTSTWTVPAGVTSILIEAWGGGAGNWAAFSGGGGGYVKAILNVTPGSGVQVIVGGGGVGITSGPFCGVNGSNSSVTAAGLSATAFGGLAHCNSISGPINYSEAGGSFSASGGIPFTGLNGEMGLMTTDSYETNPVGNVWIRHFGKGGDGGNSSNTGAVGGIAYYNYSTSALISSTSPLRLAQVPGGGAGGGTIANNGAAGIVIIHY